MDLGIEVGGKGKGKWAQAYQHSSASLQNEVIDPCWDTTYPASTRSPPARRSWDRRGLPEGTRCLSGGRLGEKKTTGDDGTCGLLLS